MSHAPVSHPTEDTDPSGTMAHLGVRALLDRVSDLQAEAQQLRQRIDELETLADTDPLVGIANRRAFVRELDRMLAFARRHGGTLSVAYLDLDDFKAINDTHGHGVGDAALAHVAHALTTHLRSSDLTGRLGGDEFAIAFPLADENHARDRVAALVEVLAQTPVLAESGPVFVHASFGVAQAKPAHDDAHAVMTRADAALITAKGAKPVRTGRR